MTEEKTKKMSDSINSHIVNTCKARVVQALNLGILT